MVVEFNSEVMAATYTAADEAEAFPGARRARLFCQAEDGGFHGLKGLVHGDNNRDAHIFELYWYAASISWRHNIYRSKL